MSFSILYSPLPSPSPAPDPLPSYSSVMHCPELDLSVTHSPTLKTEHMEQKPCWLKKSQKSDQLQLKNHPKGQTEKKNTKMRFEEPVASKVTPDLHTVPHQQCLRDQGRNLGCYQGGRCSVDPSTAAFVRDSGCLENAELNSTLALKGELMSLQETEFNLQKAIQQTLQKSGRTKTLINARTTEVVNFSRSQHCFNSLVSVSVQEDELLSQVVQARLMLAPRLFCCHDNKTAEVPSLNNFTMSELFRKKPLPQDEELSKSNPFPVASPAGSTFDLYMRQRCWEATLWHTQFFVYISHKLIFPYKHL